MLEVTLMKQKIDEPVLRAYEKATVTIFRSVDVLTTSDALGVKWQWTVGDEWGDLNNG